MAEKHLRKYFRLRKRLRIKETDYNAFDHLQNNKLEDVVNDYYEDTSLAGQSTLLCRSVISGNIKVAKYLIQQGADIDQSDRVYGNTPLIWSVLYFHKKLTKFLISSGANLYQQNFEEKTAMDAAIDSGNRDVIPSLMLKHDHKNHLLSVLSRISSLHKCMTKADKFTQNYFGNAKIHSEASRWGSFRLKSLIRHNVNVNVKNDYGETPLHIAVLKKRLSSIKLLLKNGANVDCKDIDGATALHVAVATNKPHRRNSSIIRTLIKNNANLYIENVCGQCPLRFAFESENSTSVEDMIKCIRRDDPYIVEALRMAIEYDSINTVKKIIKRCENVGSIKHDDGDNALHYAIRNKKNDIIREITHEVDINLQNNNGDTALHLAVYYELNKIVGLLLSENIDVSIQNKQGDTALHLAVKANLTFFILLVERIDIVIQNQDGDTAFHLAARYGKQDYFYAMLNESKISYSSKREEFINTQNNKADTALHHTCLNNEYDMTKALLDDNTINRGLRNNDDKLALQLAIQLNNLCIVDLFTDSSSGICDFNEYICTVCMEIPATPNHIYQCLRGHIYCENCENRDHVTSCSQCGMVIVDLIRNIELERKLSHFIPNVDNDSYAEDPFESLFQLTQ